MVRQFRDRRGRLSNSEIHGVAQSCLFAQIRPRRSAPSFAVGSIHLRRPAWHSALLGRTAAAERRIAALAESLRRILRMGAHWQELLSQPHAALALRQMQEARLLSRSRPSGTASKAWWCATSIIATPSMSIRWWPSMRLTGSLPMIAKRLRACGKLLREDEEPGDLAPGDLLLHDIGKGTTPGDHVRGSLRGSHFFDAPPAHSEARETIVYFLIKHHLDLSLIMNGRDLDDPATARFSQLKDRHPRETPRLTLLTYAEYRAVNPTAMTPWRAEQLWRVHSLASAQLTRELAA